MMTAPGYKRLWTNYFTTLANATEQKFTFSTIDDYRARHIDTVFVGLATAGVSLSLYAMGQEYSVVDLTRFAAGDAILKLQFDVPAKLQLTIGLTNLAAGALTNVPVVIGYYVDPGTGPQDEGGQLIAVPPGFYDQERQFALPRVGQQTVRTTPVQLVDYNPSRLGCVLTNAGVETVYVGPDKSISTSSGHALLPGSSLSLVSPAELWGICVTGPVLVTTLQEQVR